MIIYFSATGNSRHVATEIAKKTGDELVDISKYMKEKKFEITLKKGENIGVITPTYDLILPSIVEEFLNKLIIKSKYKKHYTFFIATYGTTIGQTYFLANKHMKQKGFPFTAYYCVKMPDTWTPIFNLSNKKKVKKQNEKADKIIKQVVDEILVKKEGDFSHHKLPVFFIKPMKAKYENIRKTKHLNVNETCIGCGLCANNCPVQAIEIKEQRPVWIKTHCVMCLSCLHHCPKFSIQYENRTQKHGQYVHP